VFARVGLKPALRKVASKQERRAVMQKAWSNFSKVNVPAHVGFTASWLILRAMLRRIYLDRSTKNLLVVKDALIAGALITGVAATITGKALKRASRAKPVAATKPGKVGEAEKPARKEKQYKRLMRLEKKLGRANMAFLAGAIIISPAIGMGIVRSQRMGLIARLLNR
jgi:hypothetical protein